MNLLGMRRPACEHTTDLRVPKPWRVHRTVLGMTKSELLGKTKLINRMRDYRLLDETQGEVVLCKSDGFCFGDNPTRAADSSLGNLTALEVFPFKVRHILYGASYWYSASHHG